MPPANHQTRVCGCFGVKRRDPITSADLCAVDMGIKSGLDEISATRAVPNVRLILLKLPILT